MAHEVTRETARARLEHADHHLVAAELVLRRNPTRDKLQAESYVQNARGELKQMPDVRRVFLEGSDDLAGLDLYERVVRCRAVQLVEPAVVRTRNGWVDAEPGQWVVEDLTGGLYTCDPTVFDARGTARRVPDDERG